MATNTKLNSVKIILSNGYEMNVLTSKTKVSEILDENHIILLQDEKSVPDGDSELSSNKTIRITKTEEEVQELATEENKEVSVEELLENYDSIVEKNS